MYIHAHSVAEQSHLATAFISSLHVKHISNEVPLLYYIHANTLYCAGTVLARYFPGLLATTRTYRNTVAPFPYHVQSLWEAFPLLTF